MLWGRLLPFLSADPQRVPVSALCGGSTGCDLPPTCPCSCCDSRPVLGAELVVTGGGCQCCGSWFSRGLAVLALMFLFL